MESPIDPAAEAWVRADVRQRVGEALTEAAFAWAQENLSLDEYRRTVWKDGVSAIALAAHGGAIR